MRSPTRCLTLLSLAAALFPGGLRAQSAAPATIGCSNDGLGRGADALVGAITGGLLGLTLGGVYGVSHRTEN